MEIVTFIISFLSSVVGAITGIGGGVIIKPVLDATGTMSVGTISFLSGLTVLSMTSVALFRSRKAEFSLDVRKSSFLAIGGAIGGIAGKGIFDYLRRLIENDNIIGAVQAAILLVLTFGVVLYIKFRKYITTYKVENIVICLIIGFSLGIISSFLGIGGGPFNVVILYWIFSMDAKTAAKNSLFIILLSQIFSLLTTLVSGTIPDFNVAILVLMMCGGVLGGITGIAILRRINLKRAQTVFVSVLIVIMGVNIFNIIQFLRIA